jgi:hypothetical protein
MVDANNGFAVGAGGVIRRWNGTTWAPSGAGVTTQNLNGVHCFDMTRCAAVGDAGTVLMWNGTSWSVTAVGLLSSRLNGVRFSTLNDAWAVGDFGATIQWDGAAWANITSPTTRNYYSVNYPGGGLAWITGEVGSILSLSVASGTNGTFFGAVLDTGLTSSVFADAFFDYASPAPAVATVAFRSGNTAVPDGTWSAWGSEHTLPAADTTTTVAIDAPSNRYLQYRLTLSTSPSYDPPTIDTYTVTYQQ